MVGKRKIKNGNEKKTEKKKTENLYKEKMKEK